MVAHGRPGVESGVIHSAVVWPPCPIVGLMLFSRRPRSLCRLPEHDGVRRHMPRSERRTKKAPADQARENAMSLESITTTCPSCKETVKAGASRCMHCEGTIPPGPTHGGTCPLCRECVHVDATRCPHCKSEIGATALRSEPAKPHLRIRVRRTGNPARLPPDCPPAFMDGSTMWCLYQQTETECVYEQCGYV